MTDGRVSVKLGDHDYIVVPQRIGYLTNVLGKDLPALLEATDEDSAAKLIGQQAHGLLSKLITGFMPEHEFMGFASESAYAESDYEREADRSPNPPEVFHAIKMVAVVNGGDALDFVKGLLGPDMLQKIVAMGVARMAEGSATGSTTPPSSPSPSGELASTSTGMFGGIDPRTDI